MSACWVFMILVGCRLSHATHSHSTCKEQLKTVSVNAGGSVVVPCPEMEGREFVFNLFKDQEMIYNCTRSDENNATSCKPPFTRVGVVQHEKEENNSSHFSLSVVNASSLGIYRCDGMVMFPPPLLKKTSALEILVLVKGLQYEDNKDCDSKPDVLDRKFFWWISVVVLLCIYSITVTIIALVYWMKLRNADSQNDYINTKPSVPRGRGKKRGVTNPIPRHF